LVNFKHQFRSRVGFGVSNVVPIIFNVAGNNQKVPTGIALTIVSSISFIGFLIGPPLIGFIAELTSLKYSFAIIGIFGIFITVLVSRLKIFTRAKGELIEDK